MNIQSAEFAVSSSRLEQCPATGFPEFAFIGRSNVGKSSLINMLTGRKGLAKTSSTPGKTKLINHFLINGQWYLVDLPGYGYAKISQSERKKWEKMILDYLTGRTTLVCTFILIDARLEPQNSDIEFINRMGNLQLPFIILFTKSDKLTKNELAKSLLTYRNKLLQWWEVAPELIVTSAETKTGRDEVLNFISKYL